MPAQATSEPPRSEPPRSERSRPEPSDPRPSEPGAVLVVSSHVARGTVGLRAATLALEALGHPVWAVPTVLLPWHPGHPFRRGETARWRPDEGAFERMLDDLALAPWLPEVRAVLTGYMASPEQVHAVARLVERVRARVPDLIVACDPVIGDLGPGGGGLYVPEAVAAAIRDALLPLADVAAPNRFELRWLSGRDAPFTTNDELRAAAKALGPARTVVTSAFGLMRGHTGNLLVDAHGATLAEHRTVPRAPNGTGDLLSALLVHHLLAGTPGTHGMLERVSASVFEVVARSVSGTGAGTGARAGADGEGVGELKLEANLASLRRPFAPVQMRRLA